MCEETWRPEKFDITFGDMADIVQSVVVSFLAPEERARQAEERALLAEERARLAEERARLAEERVQTLEIAIGRVVAVGVCSLNRCANRVRRVMASWDTEPSRREGSVCRSMMERVVRELRGAAGIIMDGPADNEPVSESDSAEDSALEEIRRDYYAGIEGDL